MSKQDRQGARTASDLIQRYNFGKTFAEVYGLVSDAQKAAEVAQKAAAEANSALSPEELFNRLTNYGEEQGIYRDGDKIYVNASYIKGGTISSDILDTTRLNVDLADVTGVLKADKVKMGGEVSFYETLDDNSGLAGSIGYVEVSSDFVNGHALGIVANSQKATHATLSAPFGNLIAVSYGDAYVISALGNVDLRYGMSLKLNGVDFGSAVSDRRQKEDIDYEASERLVSLFDTLKPVAFKMKNDSKQQHIGFIAQDVAESVESAGLGNALVVEDCRGVLNLNYGEMVAALVAKIQQLEKKIEELGKDDSVCLS